VTAADDPTLGGLLGPEPKRVEVEPCPHEAWTGDDGPVADLGRMPERWRCDGCGAVATERPVCLGCARDTYPDEPLAQSFPAGPKTCHVCGMTTEMGYSLPLRPAPLPSHVTVPGKTLADDAAEHDRGLTW
jgi:hypothetical protein